jgi:hypothetical protein
MRFPFLAPVVGTSFRIEAARAVRPGADVVLRREPTNPHDPAAVAVDVDGVHIGYLPRPLAARLDGAAWSAVVTEVRHGDGVGVQVRVTGSCAEPKPPAASNPNPQNLNPQIPTTRNLRPQAPRPQAPHDEVAPIAQSDVLVRARSGRQLGTLVSMLDGVVRVRTDDGRIVSYPADLVETQQIMPA